MANGQNTEEVTLGTGVLSLNDVPVGFLKGDVTLVINREQKAFESGIPLTVRKRVIIRESAALRAQMAQIYSDKLAFALGAGVITTPSPGSSKFSFGGDSDIDEFALKFVHNVPNSNGTITVVLFKAQPQTQLEIPFREEDFLMYNVEYGASADDTKNPGEQLGYVLFEGFTSS